jgi:hypothetical protein
MKKLCLSVCLALLGLSTFAQQLTVAVAPFDIRSGFTQDEAAAVYELFVGELAVSGTVRVVDKSSFDKTVTQMKFMSSDWSDNDKAAQIGLAMGANSIIRGQLMSLLGKPVITVNILDVNTAQSLPPSRLQLDGLGEVFDKIPGFVQTIVNNLPPLPVVYRIGDKGPAGGWIFYDKGRMTDGWRYLEAAPKETEFRGVKWGAWKNEVKTGIAIGAGKQNTENILFFLRGTEDSDKAARLCDALVVESFDDWFLPSIGELALMDKNLHVKGLGEFNGDYWSSSAASLLNDDAFFYMFHNGSRDSYSRKFSTAGVRAVRRF